MEIDFYQISLKLILTNSSEEVLILKALNNGTYAGFYDLPGGRIDKDEFGLPFEDILLREAGEEIGNVEFNLRLNPVAYSRHLIHSKFDPIRHKDTHVLYLFFKGQYIAGEIKISNEHSEYEWINLDKIELDKYFTSGLLEGIKMYLGK